MTNTIKIWAGNLGKYNEGSLQGEWFTLPVEMDEISKVIGLTGDYEELFIADYEAPFSIGEYDSIEKLNEIAERMQGMDEDEIKAIGELVENGIVSNFIEGIEELENVIFYTECQDMSDVAYSWIHDHIGSIDDAVSNREFYIDYDAVQRDLECDSYFAELEEEQGEEISEYDREQLTAEMIDEGMIDTTNYFDYEKFGRDMDIEGSFFYTGNGLYIQHIG